MQITLNIDSDDVISAVSQLPQDEKLKLYRIIKRDITGSQAKEVPDGLDADERTDDEIDEIVEHICSEANRS
jgi:hypothetical protein